MKSALIGGFISVLLFSACAEKTLPPAEYMSWVKDEAHGLCVRKQVDRHLFTLQYKPCAYEALLHSREKDLDQKKLNELMEPLKEIQYFTLTIESDDHKDPAGSTATDEADYQQRLNYLMFEMQPDFALIDGDDTLACAFYHYERNYNLAPENHILLGFESKAGEEAKNKTLLYDDHLLGIGLVQITIEATEIKEIPKLKLRN
jgi:hypothetical protein